MGCLISSARINTWLSIAVFILMLIFGAPWKMTLMAGVSAAVSWLFVKLFELRP